MALPRVPPVVIGEPGEAARLEGTPAMVLMQQPDAMLDAGQLGPVTVRAASVRGAGHRYDGTARQDDFCLGTAGPDDGWLVAVVADGVSAGPRSHIAARVAVRLGVQLVSGCLEDGPPSSIAWDELVGTIAGHVLLQARKEGGDPEMDAHAASKTMATTLAIVILPLAPDGDGRRACTVLPIGDTSVWILRAGSGWESVTAIKNDGEAVASSAVFALPLLPADALVPIPATLEPGDALFVVTDGVGDPLGDGDGEVGRALAKAWAEPPNRYEFAAQVDFGRRSHTDDRTVIGLWPDRADTSEVTRLSTDDAAVDEIDLAVPDVVGVDGAPAADTANAATVTATHSAPAPDARVTWEPMPWTPTPWTPDGARPTNG
jgi:hypothetical protein